LKDHTLKMKAARCYKMLVSYYITAQAVQHIRAHINEELYHKITVFLHCLLEICRV